MPGGRLPLLMGALLGLLRGSVPYRVSVISGPRSNGLGAWRSGWPPVACLLGAGLLLDGGRGLRRQPELEQVARRHRLVAADHDDLAEHCLERRRRRGVRRGGAGEQAAQEPARAVHAGEPDRPQPGGGLARLGGDLRDQLGAERALALLAPPAGAAISAAISARTSSHSPDRLGAANACSCSSLS